VDNAEPPVIARIDDIDPALATSAFRNTSFVAEERGLARRADYADAVNGLYRALWPLARTDEQRATLAAEMARYREGYIARMTAYLSAHSGVASSMITGPANFPVERNRKRMDRADAKQAELREWAHRAASAIERRLLDMRPDEDKVADDWESLAARLGRSLDTIREIDEASSPFDRSAFVNSIAGRVERLAVGGDVAMTDRALDYIRSYNESHAKPAIGPRHKFWTFGDLARKIATVKDARVESGPELVAEGDGVRIVANPEADRVQIAFDGKPAPDVIARLKSEAWKWSPRNGVWQRKLTPAAKSSARRVAGL
jgi:hypothetical protein